MAHVPTKVCFIVSSILTAEAFLLDHIQALTQLYNVSLIANITDTKPQRIRSMKAKILSVPIYRKISPAKDLYSLYKLYRIFAENKFALIHSVTPKAGLLAMLAGRLAKIPIRLHTFTGQVWATRHGLQRRLLKKADRFLANMATHILVDSLSQRDFLVREGVLSKDKADVLAMGSISGVDVMKFRPDYSARLEIRSEIDIPMNSIVFIYLGRLNKDKGLLDLAKAFFKLCNSRNDIHLLIVGPDEENIGELINRICAKYLERVHLVDYTSKPERYMAGADIICLPSYREGFGSAIIEAAAVGIPAIASRIYGIVDAIEENSTGLLHDPGNIEQLLNNMKRLSEDKSLRESLGINARKRVLQYFTKEQVTCALVSYYKKILKSGEGSA